QRCLERERKVAQSYLCAVQLVGIGCHRQSVIDVILLVIHHRLVHQGGTENTRDIGGERNVGTVPTGQVERQRSNRTGGAVAQALNVLTVADVGTGPVVQVPVHSTNIQPAAVVVRKRVEVVDAIVAGVVGFGIRIGDRETKRAEQVGRDLHARNRYGRPGGLGAGHINGGARAVR